MKVLLVERDPKKAIKLAAFLAAEGFRSEVADTAEDALRFVRSYEFDLLLLNLSDTEGSDFIKRVRGTRSHVPILALTIAANVQQRVAAFSAGADEVIAYSSDRSELLARMHAVVRRGRGYSEPALKLGNLTLHIGQHEVTVDDQRVALTGKEFALLHLLMRRKNMVMTKQAILSNLYAEIDEPEIKIIDVFVCKIRTKLAKAGAPDVIGTVWGRGYTVRDPARDSSVPQSPAPIERRLPSDLVPAIC